MPITAVELRDMGKERGNKPCAAAVKLTNDRSVSHNIYSRIHYNSSSTIYATAVLLSAVLCCVNTDVCIYICMIYVYILYDVLIFSAIAFFGATAACLLVKGDVGSPQITCITAIGTDHMIQSTRT